MQKNQNQSFFFHNDKLPFIEARLAINSDYHYCEHYHETLSIGAVEEGKVSYTHLGKRYLLEPNKLAIINPHEVHKCNPLKKESRTYHMLYIDTKWCKKIQKNIFNTIDEFIPINQAAIYNEKLFQEFISLNYILLNKDILLMEKEEKLYNFFYNFFSNLNFNKEKKDIQQDYSPNTIEKAKKYIKDNYSKNITIQEISNYIGLSDYYFIRSFKKFTGMTPHAFLLNEKIISAKKLLSQDYEIVDVALEVGFYDQSHFNKVFKQYVAATPFEYKKNSLHYNNE